MNNEQFEYLTAEIKALKHAVIALAFASPRPENVVAELDRQKTFLADGLNPSQASDQYIELVLKKMQVLRDEIAAQI